MKQVVVFRVDANSQIGNGHLSRCTALAQMLANDFCKVLITQSLNIAYNELLTIFSSIILITDDYEFYNALNGNEIVVIDKYNYTNKSYSLIKALGCKLIVLHDAPTVNLYADVIIDHGINYTEKKYITAAYNQLCLGTQYALLRPPFLKAIAETRTFSKVNNVFIALGSAQNKTMLDVFINGFGLTQFPFKIHVLTNLQIETQNYKEKYKQLELFLYNSINEVSLCQLMQNCQLAIVSASTISLEAMSVGMGMMLGYTANNQMYHYQACIAQNCAYPLGDFHVLNAIDLAAHVTNYINAKLIPTHIKIQKSLFPNSISKNINDIFKSLTKEFEISLNDVKLTDMEICFNWANDPVVRKFSLNSNPISWQEHVAWFTGQLKNKNNYFFIFYRYATPISIVRFNYKGNNEFEMSYLMDAKFRGKGYAQPILKLAMEKFTALYQPNARLWGTIVPSNLASIKVTQNLSFQFLPSANSQEGLIKCYKDKFNHEYTN